jgi:NADH:ubiquinone oxidoreductase subunit D
VGSLNLTDAVSYGVTGPVIKSIGVKKDLRFLRSETYAHY